MENPENNAEVIDIDSVAMSIIAYGEMPAPTRFRPFRWQRENRSIRRLKRSKREKSLPVWHTMNSLA